jgi:molybdopterin-dependent oxidoreductase alpha subunit
MPLLQAIEILLLREEARNPGSVVDRDFVEKNTEGYATFTAHLQSLDLDELIRQSGVDRAKIEETVRVLTHKQKIVACWAMGLTQHKNAVATIQEVVNLLLLKGSIGKPGAGTCPVRGHSNVQGDRTMGIYEKPAPAFLQALQKNFHFTPPQRAGYDVVQSIEAMHAGKAKVFFALGGNFLSATPDTRYTAAALQKCRLTVQVSTKLNRSHLVHGEQALILPCLGRSDKDVLNGEEQLVSCENSMGVVQASKGVLQPVSRHLLSEPVIVCRLAKATLGSRSVVNWEEYARHYDAIRDAIERTIAGFENYNQRVRMPGGFYLPNCNREGKFSTASAKARFQVATFEEPPLQPDELLMMTIRSHDQFNTTIYGLDDRYRGIYNERRVILMNQDDMNRRNLKDGDVVDLYSYHQGRTRMAPKFRVVLYPIPPGCTATYFPEANVLVPISSVADKSNTPASKSVILKVEKHVAAGPGA